MQRVILNGAPSGRALPISSATTRRRRWLGGQFIPAAQIGQRLGVAAARQKMRELWVQFITVRGEYCLDLIERG